MELLITKCLKGYVKATTLLPVLEKHVNFYHKFKYSHVQSHSLKWVFQWKICLFFNVQIQVSLLGKANAYGQTGIT